MPKDFDKWNEYKKAINENGRIVNFHEREIWWCSVGINVGSEQDSYSDNFARPIIILSKFTERTFWGVPLTTKIKKGNYRVPFIFNGVKSDMLIWHMRSYDVKRLVNRIGILSETEFHLIVISIVNKLTKSKKTPYSGVSEAEARGCTEMKSSSYQLSIENQKILSNFFRDRYLYRLAISTRM